jgi:molecular chaperone GrpE
MHEKRKEEDRKPRGEEPLKKEQASGEKLEESVSEVVEEVLKEKEGIPEEDLKHEPQADKRHKDHDSHAPLEEESKKLKDEIESLKDSRLRILAEFDNFKRRSARDSLKVVEMANEGLIKSILPVLENLERALHPDHKNGGSESLYKGV